MEFKNLVVFDISITTVLWIITLTLFIRYVLDLFGRNPRLVKFSQQLPGPSMCLPIVGNGFEFFPKMDASMKILELYEQKYGSIYRLWLGKHLVIGTTDLDHIEVIFQSSKMLDKPPLLKPISEFWGNHNVFMSPTMIWKKIRRELQPYFQKNSLSTKMPHANKIVRKYVEQLRQHIDGPEFDVGPILKLLSFDVILEILLNATLEYPADEFKTLYESFQVSDDIAFEKMFKPWLANPIADFIFFRKEKNQFRECTNKFFKKVLEKQLNSPADKLEKAEEEEDEENKITFIKLLQKIKDMYVLEKNYVQSESIVMIAAGSVTTATTASFCLMMLAMHPDIQEKLYAEIMENFGDEDKDLSINDVHNLQYLDQVLKETERRYLIVPTLFRYVNEDTKMGSYIVPKGTTMMIAMKTIHMSSKYYKNPEKFDPEHFSPEAVENRPKFAFFPFSAGPRNCIGKALAELELKLILIHFVRTFKFTTSAKMEDLKLNFGAVIYSESGYHIKVQLRDSKKTQ